MMTPDQQDLVLYTFNEIVDTAIDELTSLGLTEEDALDTVFTIATDLCERKLLPEFPDDQAAVESVGKWAIEASDFGFITFCVEAVSG